MNNDPGEVKEPYECDTVQEKNPDFEVSMLNCNDGTSQSASYSKVCSGFALLVDDLDKVNNRVSKLKQDVKDLQKEGVTNEQQLSIDLNKIECELKKLFTSHKDMERSVSTTETNVNSIQQRLSAMKIQLEELANLTPPMPDNMPNNRDLVENTGLEQPVRTNSDPVVSKGDWSGRDDVKQVIDGLRSELKRIKEDIGAGYGERSFLKLLKQFLDSEMEQRQQPRKMSVTSIDSGLESSVNQLDTPSSEGSSLQLSYIQFEPKNQRNDILFRELCSDQCQRLTTTFNWFDSR